MGFDCDRFENPSQVDAELICSICSGVFDNPVQLPECEHVFCAVCIERWLLESSKCPLDRKSIQSSPGEPRGRYAPRPAPRIFRTLLGRMRIRCLFHTHGCSQLLNLEHLEQHQLTCPHNPEGLVTCDKGCGTDYKKSAGREHNCVTVLKDKLEEAMTLIQLMSGEIGELKRKVKELEQEPPMANGRASVGRRSRAALWTPEAIMAWARHLSLAQVTYWGGLISTPDAFLQNQVREALENSCAAANGPLELIEALMHNSHERAWPPGLRTLERRLFNRTIYEAYACRRVPGNQAVIILSEDNRHMSDDMILHPGLVVIFAHGVEDCDPLQNMPNGDSRC
ncbi:LOW QUALITY PROTEIN: E3 ubiquitin-protein ligase NRDP1-like [Paramacrobiotus metropolitanus]|uniref:LOW QUALITY PROTEIN: E3 ubiquitin-protein ligase NRDP1-like n=1 Tax=Paramacrobiotus metropolitanus TaxID=2943436 RepID=UPI0024462E3A|nr:LOW QUALITY PROTEIN: E3 ubiquitin-protein ligase NRDP1-like [Paramacrobiotus metropolitanus]